MHDERACHGCAAALFSFLFLAVFSCTRALHRPGPAATVSHRDGLMGYPRLISSGTRSAATHKIRATPTSPLETKKNPWTPAITNALVPSRQSGGHVAGCRASPARVSVYGDGRIRLALCLPRIIPRLESSSVPFCSENDRPAGDLKACCLLFQRARTKPRRGRRKLTALDTS